MTFRWIGIDWMAWKVSVYGRWRNRLVSFDVGIWSSGRNPTYVFHCSMALGFIWNPWNVGIMCSHRKCIWKFYCSVVIGSGSRVCDRLSD